jgi:hypothetical protein
MLDLPDIVYAKLVSQFDLIESLIQESLLGSLTPRTGHLMLIKKAESHGISPAILSRLPPSQNIELS